MDIKDIKKKLRTFWMTKAAYQYLKKIYHSNKTRCKYSFANRSKNRKKLCVVLAGYKPFLYESVFGRIEKYIDEDIDVCIITSGLFSKEVSAMCKNNNWSYLSTKENNVSLVQNVAIMLHPNAEYIYKLDEDIFVTKDYFSKMFDAYKIIKETAEYKPGFLAPLIPVNGYAHLRVLKKLNLVQQYEELFERPIYEAGSERMIENDPKVAKFFWGEGGYIPSIDELNKQFGKEELSYTACPVRFSIGAIFFTRETFEKMGMYSVKRSGNPMGRDEIDFCNYCMKASRAIIVVENTAVGHLAFGRQNEEMKEYYLRNKGLFTF